MKKALIYFATALSLDICSFSANTAFQNLTVSAPPSSTITTSGSPNPLSITLNEDGTGSVQDITTTYSLSSNTNAKGSLKVTGSLTRGGNMPQDTTLTVNLGSSKGFSKGEQILSASPVDLVINLPTLVSDSGSIIYIFSVKNGWTLSAQTLNRVVTLTLTSAS